MVNTDKRTDFLLKKRNLWSGVSSILNVSGFEKKFNTSKTAKEADYKALKSDWEMIGKDINKAMIDLKLQECE